MRNGLGLVAACAAFLLVGSESAAAAPGNVTCRDVFAATAYELTVPADNFCELAGATITHDLIIESDAGVFAHGGVRVGHDAIEQANDAFLEATHTTVGHDVITQTGASLHLGNTTIGRDLIASKPGTVQTGEAGGESGPVKVGRDLVISGSPSLPFVFDGICDLTVGRDLRMTARSVTLGFSIGDEEACAGNGEPPVTVGHDLVVTGNSALSGFFGPSSLDVGDNRVGHDLIFSGNTAVPGGYLEVSDNRVGHDAICTDNSSALSSDDLGDGSNIAGGTNTCG
jgi:hypothetical protein